MANIVAYSRVKAKATRKTARKPAPFGAGILPRSAASRPSREDELWWAQQTWAEAEISDREYDAMAQERAWEAAYEAGFVANDRCILCGLESPGGTTNGLCAGCAEVLERDGEIRDGGGTCNICGRPCDYLEESGACLPCDLAASEKHSFSGPRGY